MVDVAKILESMDSEFAPKVVSIIEQATEARGQIAPGSMDDDVVSLHEQLLSNRSQIERLEHLTSAMVLLKSRTAQSVASCKAAYDDAYQAAATSKTVSFGDYSSAKEKDAHHNLKTIDETLMLRKAEAVHRDVEAAWDYCRILLRGAEATNRDIEIRIRLLTLSSALER